MKSAPDGGALGDGRWRGLLAALGSALRRIERVAQVLACLEANVLRCRDRDLLFGAGVAALARLALRNREAAEARDRAALAALTRVGNVADERIKRSRGLLLGNPCLLGNCGDDVT